ncbi:MAG: hypothetical protein K2Z80_14450 [Xanthobacteraceae bacterium]|nr:hypothetical protein [Xanthobacteraceae bacterium]
MHIPDPVHRHFDGSVDFDRYRAEINALRRSAMQDGPKLGAALKVMTVVGVMLAAAAMAPSRQDAEACHVCKPSASHGTSHGGGLSVWRGLGIEPSLY